MPHINIELIRSILYTLTARYTFQDGVSAVFFGLLYFSTSSYSDSNLFTILIAHTRRACMQAVRHALEVHHAVSFSCIRHDMAPLSCRRKLSLYLVSPLEEYARTFWHE